jgi:hypothetical protein
MTLEAQAEFVVLWWDTHVEKAQGRRNDKLRNGSETKLQAGQDGLPDRQTIHRWPAARKPGHQRLFLGITFSGR